MSRSMSNVSENYRTREVQKFMVTNNNNMSTSNPWTPNRHRYLQISK